MIARSGWVAAFALLLAIGCSRTPSRVAAPHVHPRAAAAEAIALYDTNGDGVLSREELAQCPAMLQNFELYDTNGDGKIQQEEIAERIAELHKDRVALTRLQAKVLFNGRPLPGAVVRFEPEPYLGGEIQPAEGITNRHGTASMAIAEEHLPEQLRHLSFVHYGTYKVHITHPEVTLPPRYRSGTQLGYETEVGNPHVTFSLTSR